MNEKIIYIALILIGICINAAWHTIVDNRVYCLFHNKRDKESRMKGMNKRMNTVNAKYIKSIIKTSVYFGGDPAYALRKTAMVLVDGAEQIEEQRKERAR